MFSIISFIIQWMKRSNWNTYISVIAVNLLFFWLFTEPEDPNIDSKSVHTEDEPGSGAFRKYKGDSKADHARRHLPVVSTHLQKKHSNKM